MALSEFLRNVKTAARFLPPRPATGPIAQRLERAAIWLTPGAVKGFDAEDFRLMPPAERDKLQAAVRRFQEAVEKVSAEPATPPQKEEARAALEQVRAALEPYLKDPEGRRVLEILQRASYPDYVVGFDYELGKDSTGVPAVWVYVVIEDWVVDAPDFGKKVVEIDGLVISALEQAGVERWPYVNFQGETEQRGFADDDES